MKKFINIAVILMVVVLSITAVACTTNDDKQPSQNENEQQFNYGEYSYSFLQTFNTSFNKRKAGSEGELKASEYIAEQAKSFGYEPEIQKFSFEKSSGEVKSQNVIFKKQGKDTSKTIIVGAHYDSVLAGYGIDDNASGVAVMLEAAKYYANKKPSCNITFVAFGSEEVGLKGSSYYASKMTEEEIKNTKFMVNLDTLAGGDKMYAYGGKDNYSQQLLKDLLAFGKEMNLETQQGLNPNYEAGTTGDWSDHASFKKLGIPFIYFESTNWTIKEADGTYTDGYVQIEDGKGGYAIMHTDKDNLDYLNKTFPGRVQEHMTVFSKCLIELIK